MIRPQCAMVLAAGLSKRMRPLTDRTAKPLLRIHGRALLDYALDRLAEAGVELAVVNAHWHADQVEAHLKARRAPPRTVIRREETLLETGGGVLAALPLVGEQPFYVVNGDAFWLDGPVPALERLAVNFAIGGADSVLLLQRTSQVQADVGLGDFALDKWGVPRRRDEREVVPYIYAGVHLMAPALLAGLQPGSFSMNAAWDRALAAGRLRAVVHDGIWFHLSSPRDLEQAGAMLEEYAGGPAK
jgi:N-acetyl-alpha-D-muramate 1-phosphate uridylyltransferase